MLRRTLLFRLDNSHRRRLIPGPPDLVNKQVEPPKLRRLTTAIVTGVPSVPKVPPDLPGPLVVVVVDLLVPLVVVVVVDLLVPLVLRQLLPQPRRNLEMNS